MNVNPISDNVNGDLDDTLEYGSCKNGFCCNINICGTTLAFCSIHLECNSIHDFGMDCGLRKCKCSGAYGTCNTEDCCIRKGYQSLFGSCQHINSK
ncbi:hypothetical protein PIROE2DRAFT_13881 [Piromyces sp. E2]|nr:hypothetical protein PIROE2DRAFT_13881 [Piromyces sp. E2]|eukprot:OUM60374.1 hypothetical protein PIROE2DRAFT_13881 [Piromyces sp. E2]